MTEKYRSDWDKAFKKYNEFWAMENHDRPLLCINAPRPGRREEIPYTSIEDQWLNTEKILQNARIRFEGTYYAGERLPTYNPNLGPDSFGALLGCDITLGADTSWAHPVNKNYAEMSPFPLQKDGIWWKRLTDLAKAAVDDAKGDYLVGLPDIHAGADALVSLRSPEQLCLDMIEQPEAVSSAVMQIWEGAREVYQVFYDICRPNQKGSISWAGIWHPGLWYITSCDFICMISKEMFSAFIEKELKAQLDFLEASIFHLDGPNALRHLDALLAIPKLKGIQWVPGAGGASQPEWLPVLQKIQAAGKCLQIHIRPEDLPFLLENLKPEGLHMSFACSTPEEADASMALAESQYNKKLF